MVDLEDGAVPAGVVTFDVKGEAGPPAQDGPFTYRFGDPSYVVEVTLSDEVWEVLGSAANEVFFNAFSGEIENELPVLRLAPPFRWATDLEVPTAMEVTFETFAVRRGCDGIAVACSPQGGVQVIPLDRFYPSAPQWDEPRVSVFSQASRPEWHPSYVDPGSLDARVSPAVVWAGSEMIVWGGYPPGGPPLGSFDGAAYNPTAGRWRTLSPSPLAGRGVLEAVWADKVMIVVSDSGTLAYDPESDVWTEVAAGVPALFPGEIVWAGGSVYLWDGEMWGLNPVRGRWTRLPPPPFEISGQLIELYAFGERLLLVASQAGACDGLDMALWDGGVWESLPGSPDALACTSPKQLAVVGGSILVWNSLSAAFSLTPTTGEWAYVGDPRLGELGSTFGAVVLDDRVLIPADGTAVLYDPAAATWTRVLLPGLGGPAQMVWTGREVLKWGWTGVDSDVDAWRWTPPEP
jgi:hypothetical protein